LNLQVKHLKLIIPAAFSFPDRAGREFRYSKARIARLHPAMDSSDHISTVRNKVRKKGFQENADPMLPKSGVIITRTTETSPG